MICKKTARLKDCWSTRRGGDILHFQAYILGHAEIMDSDNILNSTDNDVETVLTERGHNRVPLNKRWRDLNSFNKKGSFELEIEGKHQNFHFPVSSFYFTKV